MFVQNRGEAAVFRVVPSKVKTLDELGMPKVLKDLSDRGFISVESKSITIINRELPPSL